MRGPHFHARYAGSAASVDLTANSSPVPCRLAPSCSWRTGLGHTKSELETNWERARRCESLAPIDPSLRIRRVERLVDVVAVEVVGQHRL